MPVGGTPHGYIALYQNIALYPELGLFRRFGGYWAKKLHDDTCEFLDCLGDVNKQIQDRLGEDSILDCPLVVAKEKCPKDKKDNDELYLAWKKYDEALLQYGEPDYAVAAVEADNVVGQTLCMSEQIMKLPCQDAYFTKHLSEFKPPKFRDVFDGGNFAPTGEKAKIYQDLLERQDTCAWATLPSTDFLTTRFQHSGKWIERHILSRLRRCSPFKKSSRPGIQTDVRNDRIVGVMDTIACLVASALLTASVLALTWVGPLRTRIAIVGAFGTLFALLVKLLAGNVGRGEIFTATAAYFAVAVVFVSSTTTGSACRQAEDVC
jgi:hypothetical protein